MGTPSSKRRKRLSKAGCASSGMRIRRALEIQSLAMDGTGAGVGVGDEEEPEAELSPDEAASGMPEAAVADVRAVESAEVADVGHPLDAEVSLVPWGVRGSRPSVRGPSAC